MIEAPCYRGDCVTSHVSVFPVFLREVRGVYRDEHAFSSECHHY